MFIVGNAQNTLADCLAEVPLGFALLVWNDVYLSKFCVFLIFYVNMSSQT